MERIIRNRSATLLKTFYADGVPTDPTGTPTVSVTRSDGTTVTTGAVTNETPAGTWSVTIPATSNTLLDTLTVRWTATVNSVAQEYSDIVEVAGDTLFSIAQARSAIGDAAFDAATIADARTYAETELESALGFALVPRFSLETKSGSDHGSFGSYYGCWTRGYPPLRLRPYVRAIRSVTVSGTILTAPELASLTFEGGFLRGYSWPTGYSNVIVGYEHGLDTPTPGARRAALSLALDFLSDETGSSIDPRAESIVTVDGTVRLRAGNGQFSAAGVNEWVTANRLPMLA